MECFHIGSASKAALKWGNPATGSAICSASTPRLWFASGGIGLYLKNGAVKSFGILKLTRSVMGDGLL